MKHLLLPAVLLLAQPAFPFSLTQKFIDGLPPSSQDTYLKQLPGIQRQAAEKAEQHDNKLTIMGSVLLMPNSYSWAEEGPEGGFPQFWPQDKSGGMQWATDATYDAVVRGLRERGFTVYETKDLKAKRGKLPDLPGDAPKAYDARNMARGTPMYAYAFSHDKLKVWWKSSFFEIKQSIPDLAAVVYVKQAGAWIYEGHTKLNDEALVNFKTATWTEVKVCRGMSDNDCFSIKVPGAAQEMPQGPSIAAALVIPAAKAGDEKRRAVNNEFAVTFLAKVNSTIALAGLDALMAPAQSFDAKSAEKKISEEAMGATLKAPASLKAGQYLVSKDQRFQLLMQPDGNLVLYWGSPRKALWASGTDGKGATLATMQEDGNLVLYMPDGKPIWSSNTWKSGAVRATMQDDGNFVLYKADDTPVWASQTHGH